MPELVEITCLACRTVRLVEPPLSWQTTGECTVCGYLGWARLADLEPDYQGPPLFGGHT